LLFVQSARVRTGLSSIQKTLAYTVARQIDQFRTRSIGNSLLGARTGPNQSATESREVSVHYEHSLRLTEMKGLLRASLVQHKKATRL